MVVGEEVGDGCAPFDDDDVGWISEIIGEVFGHEAGIGETVEIVVDKTAFTTRQGVGFGNSEAGASDWLRNAETSGEATYECGFAGANVAN